jgi:hypothetical protein
MGKGENPSDNSNGDPSLLLPSEPDYIRTPLLQLVCENPDSSAYDDSPELQRLNVLMKQVASGNLMHSQLVSVH